jgi:adenylate cyclase class IV
MIRGTSRLFFGEGKNDLKKTAIVSRFFRVILMIEVEKKFSVGQDELARLIARAQFLGEKKFTDVYYDTADYALTKKDIWLRARSGKFELKFPMAGANEGQDMTAYDEIEDDAAIAAKLGILGKGPIERLLAPLGYLPFATITTTRSKYEKDGFHIDVDAVDFGYALLEIELMVAAEGGIEAGYRRILNFAAMNGIPVSEKRIRGKVVEYLRRNDPDHFHALEIAWGVKL